MHEVVEVYSSSTSITFTSIPKKKKKNFIVKEKKAMKVMMNIDRQSTDDTEDTFVTAETIK